MANIFQITCLLCLVFAFANADGVEKCESDLRQFLFENYDKLVRPVSKTTHTIPVHIGLSPLGIRDVDVKDRMIKMDTWLYVRWEAEQFRWDVAEYGVDHLVIPADTVWKPDISVYTGVPDSMLPTVMTNVIIFNNGSVLWVPPLTVKSRCPPAENQITEDSFQCTVQLGSWTYHVGLLDVQEYVTDQLERAESFDNVHPKWILESMTASTELKKYRCCKDLYPVVKFHMVFRKRPIAEQ